MFNSTIAFRTALSACALASVALLHIPPAKAATESVVHSFQGAQGGNDGAYPRASLINVNGTLYGTDSGGGAHNWGTVFKVNPMTGTETVLWSFGNGTDGAYPQARLLAVGGTLYGTTNGGGCGGIEQCGTLFAFDPRTGTEKVLHSFGTNPDGGAPAAGLIVVGDTLYGTTESGGRYGGGTIFSYDLSTAKEKVLHSFKGSASAGPSAGPNGLIDFNGTLYGTTTSGGPNHAGTVFSFVPGEGEKVIYEFQGGSDGWSPGDLISVNNTLYGTTSAGGAGNGGTVFSLDPATGAKTVLYAFQGGSDGADPRDGLISVGGTLYGTTVQGGGGGMYGTVFSVTPSGTEKVLYSFCSKTGCSDGATPLAGLSNVKGTLYGTTYLGGAGSCTTTGGFVGCGTVFAITP